MYHIFIGFLENISRLYEIHHKIIEIFTSVKPNPEFLTDIATFSGLVVTFLIPIGLEIINRTTEKTVEDQKSFTDISKLFVKESKLYWNLYLGFGVLISSISLRLLFGSGLATMLNINNLTVNLILTFLFLSLVSLGISFIYYINKLIKFITGLDYILRYNCKRILDNNPTSKNEIELGFSYQYALTRYYFNVKYLNQFQEQVENLSQYIIRFGKINHQLIDSYLVFIEKQWFELLKDGEIRRAKSLIGQTYYIFHIDSAINQKILQFYTQLFFKVLNYNKIVLQPSLYFIFDQWYFSQVFNAFGDDFDIFQLELFHNTLWTHVRTAVDEDQFELFKFFFENCNHQNEPASSYANIWRLFDYQTFNKEFDLPKIKILDRRLNKVENASQCAELIEELKNLIDVGNIEKNETLQSVIETVNFNTKWNSLKKLLYTILIYALSRKKYHWISFVWFWRTPEDAEGQLINIDPILNTVYDLIVYSIIDHSLREFEWHDEIIRGSSLHVRRFITLNLIFIFSKNGGITNLEVKDLKKFDQSKLKSIHYDLNELIKTLDDSKLESIYSSIVEQNSNNFTENKFKLQGHLANMLNNTDNALVEVESETPFSSNKIKDFKSEVVKNYKPELIELITLLKPANIKHKTNSPEKLRAFGLSEIFDRTVLQDQKYIDSDNLGGYYSNSLERFVNTNITDKIRKNCKKAKIDELEQILKNQDPEFTIILYGTIYFPMEIEFNKISQISEKKTRIIENYSGTITIANKKFKIFNLSNIDDEIIVINLNKLGQINIYPPDDKVLKIDNDSEVLENIYFSIKGFTENPDLTEKLLNENPPWLSQKYENDDLAKRKYLANKVRIQIYAKFEYLAGKNIGWVFKDKEN